MGKYAPQIMPLIKAKFEGLVDGNGKKIFKEVKGFLSGNFSGFPSALIKYDIHLGELLDTARNERTYNFRALLYQEQSDKGKQNEESVEILAGIVEAVEKAFDQDVTLGGEVMRVMVTQANPNDEASGDEGSFVFSDMLIQVVDLVDTFNC